MPSRTARRGPAMLTTRVLPEIPARPRETPASTMPADKPEQRSDSAMPRRSRYRGGRVGSGGRARGVGGCQGVADVHLIGGDPHDPVDDEAGFAEKFGDQRSAVIFLVTVRS